MCLWVSQFHLTHNLQVEYATTDAFTYPGAPQVFSEAIADSLNGYAASDGVAISTVDDAPQCVLNPDFATSTGRRLLSSMSSSSSSSSLSSSFSLSASFFGGSGDAATNVLRGRNVNGKAVRALQEDQVALQRRWLMASGVETTPSYTPTATPVPTGYIPPGDILTCGDVIKGSTVDTSPLWSDDDYTLGAQPSGDQSSTWGAVAYRLEITEPVRVSASTCSDKTNFDTVRITFMGHIRDEI